MLIFASIVISKWGCRFGVPTLLLFLFTGMLFGSDGHEDYLTNSATKTAANVLSNRKKITWYQIIF